MDARDPELQRRVKAFRPENYCQQQQNNKTKYIGFFLLFTFQQHFKKYFITPEISMFTLISMITHTI